MVVENTQKGFSECGEEWEVGPKRRTHHYQDNQQKTQSQKSVLGQSPRTDTSRGREELGGCGENSAFSESPVSSETLEMASFFTSMDLTLHLLTKMKLLSVSSSLIQQSAGLFRCGC